MKLKYKLTMSIFYLLGVLKYQYISMNNKQVVSNLKPQTVLVV